MIKARVSEEEGLELRGRGSGSASRGRGRIFGAALVFGSGGSGRMLWVWEGNEKRK